MQQSKPEVEPKRASKTEYRSKLKPQSGHDSKVEYKPEEPKPVESESVNKQEVNAKPRNENEEQYKNRRGKYKE